eukprot:COSAG01_NODE_3039_length_6684_cov_8.217464_3_plen_115_part_00
MAAIRAKADSAEALQKELDETKQALAKSQQQVSAVAPGPDPAGAGSAPQGGTPPVNAAMTGTWREAVMPKVNAITAHMLAELENTLSPQVQQMISAGNIAAEIEEIGPCQCHSF